MKKFIRVAIYIIGLGILALGVVLNTKTGLGVSAINSVPYAISVLTGKTLGDITIVVYTIYILIQLFLVSRKKKEKSRSSSLLENHIEDGSLGKSKKWIVLLQLPCTILFGKYTDFFNQMIQIKPSAVVYQYALLAGAIFCTSLGVVLVITMKIVPNAPDGLVQEIAVMIKKDFGFVKNMFDIFCILISLLISLLFEGRIIGIGIGTVLSALLIGRVIAMLNKMYKKRLLYFTE